MTFVPIANFYDLHIIDIERLPTISYNVNELLWLVRS